MKLQIGIDGKSYEVEVEVTEDDAAPKPHYIPAQPSATVVTAAPAAAGAPKASVSEGPVDEAKVCRSPIAGMVTRVKRAARTADSAERPAAGSGSNEDGNERSLANCWQSKERHSCTERWSAVEPSSSGV